MQARKIKMKFRGECHHCHNNLPEGTEVWWTKGVGVKCIEDCPKRYKKKRKKKRNGSGNVKHRANQGVRLLTGSNRQNR